jgi:hypothetical protein
MARWKALSAARALAWSLAVCIAARAVDPPAVVPGGTFGGERGGGRLDDRAHLLDCQQKVAIRLVLADEPAQHVAVEQAPFVARQHVRAVAWPHADETLRSKRLDGLAHHAASDAEPGFELRLGRQSRPHGNEILGDLAAERRQHGTNAAGLDRLVDGARARSCHSYVSPAPAGPSRFIYFWLPRPAAAQSSDV